jgi:hypothetical protein
MAVVEESEAGTSGNPALQDGGEQEALTAPEPGDGVVTVQDSRHEVLALTAAGCDAVQVRGILESTIPPLVLGRELLPMMSVRVAKTV